MIKKVSIILPTFNAQETIETTIKSVLDQTYSNIELLIVDDGSNDNTVDICCRYTENPKIKLFCKENSGVSNTRNFAINNAEGTYIMFIDSDDVCSKDCVAKMVQDLEENKAQLTICGYSNVNYKNNKETKNKIKKQIYNKLQFDKLIIDTQNNNLFNPIWNKIFLKEIIENFIRRRL